jgi:hypothetical protein
LFTILCGNGEVREPGISVGFVVALGFVGDVEADGPPEGAGGRGGATGATDGIAVETAEVSTLVWWVSFARKVTLMGWFRNAA